MRVIITGGSGLIGQGLCRTLVENDYEVVVLTRQPTAAQGHAGVRNADMAGVQYSRWDGRSVEGWVDLIDGARAVVNLAGANIAGGRWTAARRQAIERSRLDSGAAIVAACRSATRPPQVLIQASAVGYYGPRGDEALTEQSAPGSDFFARVAVAWEDSTSAVEALGVRRVVVRSGVVLSPMGGALPKLMLPFRFFVGGKLGTGRQWLSWIHMVDEIEAIRFLLEHPTAHGAFNLTSPNPERNADFARVLGEVMRRPAWMPVPGFALRLLFGEMATVLLDGQRVIPQRLLERGFKFRYPNSATALRNALVGGR